MYGSELALLSSTNWKGRIVYSVVGIHHMANYLRFLCNVRVSRHLLKSHINILEVGSERGIFVFWLARKYPEAQVLGVEVRGDLVRECN